ncbi:Metallo-hydrolase/oxidoreductase [Xylona heveae TC161]|uniref:Metallo-hydrolase/oxidoreductase n=1 Tax=Xylona heveae (strain CBS 132557 / TC161) TaxID=1328760 RepID=A0A164ZY14_XYLHT|nr:Metallo-hydrolase/oxidoreductase [Xylona heveae TC161]KZF19682.1 Metallo-hydrolase/oxidoreductase [Xylona heveae TC161]
MSSSITSALAYATTVSTPAIASSIPEEAAKKVHHAKDGKGFINPWASYREMSVSQILRGLIWRHLSGKANNPDTTPPTVNVRKPEFLPSRQPREQQAPSLRATWLGHACFYVEFPSGFRVLFDPVFTARCSPFSFFGPKRYTDVPCQIEDIPTIDAVVISHNHYDHLSHPTIMKIKELHPNVHFFAPLGNKKWFLDCGITNVTELDWWESRDISLSAVPSKDQSTTAKPAVTNPFSDSQGTSAPPPSDIKATVGCLPCQHTSARTPFDKAHTLWCSWSVESGGARVYFGGDTGYRTVPELPKHEDDYGHEHADLPHCPAFKQIGELRGPFDLGLIPIGAYEPRYIMSPMHADPADAVNIFRDTKCRSALGIHWGTWVLTEEDVLEPPRRLRKALASHNLPETGVFDVCEIGESREISLGKVNS